MYAFLSRQTTECNSISTIHHLSIQFIYTVFVSLMGNDCIVSDYQLFYIPYFSSFFTVLFFIVFVSSFVFIILDFFFFFVIKKIFVIYLFKFFCEFEMNMKGDKWENQVWTMRNEISFKSNAEMSVAIEIKWISNEIDSIFLLVYIRT